MLIYMPDHMCVGDKGLLVYHCDNKAKHCCGPGSASVITNFKEVHV